MTDFDYYVIMKEICDRCHKQKGYENCPEDCMEDCEISKLVWNWLKGENDHEEKSEG